MTTFDYNTTTFRHKAVGHQRGRLTVDSRFDGVIDVVGKRAQIAILRWCCEQLRVYASAIEDVGFVLHLDALAETIPRDALVNPNDMEEQQPSEPRGELTLVPEPEPRGDYERTARRLFPELTLDESDNEPEFCARR
jgi:hypothetical protein